MRPALLPLFVVLVLGACQFNPKIPDGRLLCRGPGDCPRGYTCEYIEHGAIEAAKICCNVPGCTKGLAAPQVERIKRAAAEIEGRDGSVAPGRDAGVDAAADAGSGCPAGCGNPSCPTSCPNEACKKRRLADPGTCQARCVDDGMETECVSGDGCCPDMCNATNDSDCRASCGNMAVEAGETCDPQDSCPTTCPAIGCTLQRVEGAAASCDARCVEAGKQTMCMSGDACCPMGCTTANDKDCECTCGNGTIEGVCGETCDPLGSCPQACPPMGCQLRRLVNMGTCQAQCVDDGVQSRCVNGDGCCPGTCNATNDNDCTARCNNGAVESGETCDPPGSCPQSCAWNGCGRRKLEGMASTCTARCVDDGTQTECASGDGCCPSGCNSGNDDDCSARCGNGVREGNEKCDGDCPQTCPNQGCQRRRLQGSAAQCTAECVNDGTISTCGSGDMCCPAGCNRNNDAECACMCGNGTVEPACGEKCEGASCPTSCPPMGCQLRRLQGTGCMAECVPDGMRTTCTSNDGCCPGGCTANNDNDCQPRCGNGAVETGETCDPMASCQMQFDACVSDRNFVRTRTGNVANCTFRCTSVARTCSGTSDGQCPTMPACVPCGATCAAGQDIDCKLTNGTACTHANQCNVACVDGRCCESTCTAQCRSCAIAGMLGLCRNIASGADTNSTPACSGNSTCSNGSCLLGPGQPCTANTQCAAGVCGTFFRDADGDAFGNGNMIVRVCGSTPPSGHVTNSTDCCDTDNRAFPSQTNHFTTPRTGCGGFDFDCNELQTVAFLNLQNCSSQACAPGWCPVKPDGTPGCGNIVPSCGQTARWWPCHRTGPGGGFCDFVDEQRTQPCR